MIDRTGLAVLIGLLTLASGLQCPKQKISPGREVVCYTSVTDVERLTEAVCKCTTLVQQGYDVRNVSISEFETFQKSLKEIIPTLQFAISVNDPESTLRTSGMVRQEIVARLMGVFKELDAIELNMTAGSKERLSHFVKGLRDELVRKSYDKRIFLVLPTKSENLAKQFDLKDLTKYVDLFTIPTHYLVEDDDAQSTFHPSRLMGLFDMFNADSLIDLISGLGAPKRKILISVPASAYRFTLKDQDDNAPRAPTEETQPVVIDQRQLCDLMNKGEWTVERDEDLTAPYAFKDKTWIAFEDKISISIKGKYALLRDLPGLAVHEIENDLKTSCAEPLTHEVHRSFSDFKRKSRAAVLNALEDDLHQMQLEYTTKVKSSDFRVVRVVDTEGHIRVVRENTQTEFTCSRQGYFVHPKSCNRFYRCVKFNQEVEDYSVFEFDCPAGLSFDERTEVCVWPGSMPEGSPCPGSSEIAPVARVRFECPSKSGYYADPQNPRWFFACIDLGRPEIMAYEFRCPFGLIFDEQKLVCEWPWLVAGYSGSAYERPEYDFGAGASISTGGYYTGGLPHGYTGAPGGYSGSTIGVGYTDAGSGFSGTGGYSSQGATGTGYSGAAGVGHGVSFGGQGSGGYTGSTGSGYSGTAGHGVSFGGQGSGGYTGSTGSGYSGTAGHGVSFGGQGSGGYTGAADAGHGISVDGQGSGGYTGSAGSGYTVTVDHGVSYGSQGGYTGSTGSGSGTAGGGYSGSGKVETGTGQGYSGGSTSNVYTGSGIGYSTGTIHAGSSVGTGYSKPGGTGYSFAPGYSSSVGGGYSGSTQGGYSGSIGGGYSGTTSTVHGGSTGGYSGSIGGGYSGTTSTIHGGSSGGYSGSIGGGYSGTTSSGHAGGGGYSGSGGYTVPSYGSVPGVDYSGTGTGATGHGYSGETGTKYTGSSSGIGFGGPTQTPIYASSGPIGTGLDVSGVHSQTPGPVLLEKPEQPICITSCYPQPSSGPTYNTDGYVSSGVTSGTNIYQGGYTGSRNISFGGSYIPSIGTSYHGGVTPSGYPGAGTIITGQNVHGSIITGDSTPGTLITYGQSPGTVFGGSTDQGSILTGDSRPGYTQTGPGSPGYVVSQGVKTVYGSASPGTVLYGTPSPGIAVTGSPGSGTIIKGQPSPGIVLTGQTAPGVSLGGTVQQGTIIGSTGHVYPGTGYTQQDFISGSPFGIRTTTATYNSGYKTNEYHDNGGRGTIKFNNGDVTTKYTENDLPDYRPAGGTIPPDTLIPGSKGVPGPSTPTGFSKTGLTQSGVTSGTLAAGGSYVIGTGRSRPTPKPDIIGANAFEGSVAGYTKSSTESSVTSTYNQDINRVDTSKIDLGLSKGPGYSYPTPSIPFQTGTRVSSTESSIFGSTTPTPFLNVELYNTPRVPTFVSKPTGFTRAPFYTSGGTTLDDYKTTFFEAAKIPISTVQPIDTGYKTSTPIPVTHYGGSVQTGTQFGFGNVQVSRDRGYSSTTPVPIPAATPTPQYEYRPTVGPSGSGYFSSTSKSIFGENVTPSGISESLRPQKTYTTGPSGYAVDSGTISGFTTSSRGEDGKFIGGYNRGTTKYIPSEYDVYQGSISGGDYSRTQQGYSSTISGFDYSKTRQGYGSTQSPLAVTTYSGVYSKPSPVITYQTTAKSTAVGKGKVIVKWSDLHPILLGKLGAECTCRGDPFANLRGPGSKLINSSKGKVDLANYDESDIYVDLEKENSYEEGDYSSREYQGPVKIWNNQIPKIPSSEIQEKPSSTYLPSVTPSAGLGARASVSGFSNRGFAANFRAGKSLNSVSNTNSFNAVANKNSSVEQPAFGESEEVIDGVTNCARPGLFRHPNFCNKFYACHWDEWKKKFTLHVFNCPVHLTFDNGVSACNWPSMGPACQDDNLLV
ncbi:mucin-19-like isoform X2 [Ceratina calcarata]|uniref:Mucin-19-like isoform X1 n=1 Tax=Ceratina calcarata TaxID=156304 RepID=A0AAJ7WBI5_9HYME|nr:mucin-19-like isoform X1 [Ceratina calcarata]XP_026670313.1 mucin-19-like isoform X2 [Ceratina calcarata]